MIKRKKSFLDELDKETILAGEQFILEIKKGLYINRHIKIFSSSKKVTGD